MLQTLPERFSKEDAILLETSFYGSASSFAEYNDIESFEKWFMPMIKTKSSAQQLRLQLLKYKEERKFAVRSSVRSSDKLLVL